MKPWTRRAVALALVGASACAGPQSTPEHEPQLADMARITSIVQQPRTQALLVVFWATWCEPCVEEIPDLVRLHDSARDELQIVSVSLDAFLHPADRSLELVRQQLAAAPTPWAQLVYTGPQDPLFGFFDMPGGIPYAVLYDARGVALERFPGKVQIDVVRRAVQRAG